MEQGQVAFDGVVRGEDLDVGHAPQQFGDRFEAGGGHGR